MMPRLPSRVSDFGFLFVVGLAALSLWPHHGAAEEPTVLRGRLESVPSGAAVHLTLGESLIVTVLAKEPWNDTHLQVLPGETYDLQPQPAQLWEDDTVGVEADGKTNWFFRLYMTPFRPLRRAKKVPFFSLAGQVGQGPAHQAFLIGKSLHWKASTAGRLFCYANDVKGFYWNNTGAMTMIITRVRK